MRPAGQDSFISTGKRPVFRQSTSKFMPELREGFEKGAARILL
jgi:hypothetical protein